MNDPPNCVSVPSDIELLLMRLFWSDSMDGARRVWLRDFEGRKRVKETNPF
jgi:hypothetical protein